MEMNAPPPGRLLVGYFREAFGYHIERRRGTRDWLLTFTLRGAGAYRFAGAEQRCDPGDIVLLAPGTPHDYRVPDPGAGWQFYWAHFTPQNDWLPWLTWVSQSDGFPRQHVRAGVARDRLSDAFARALADNLRHGAHADALAHSALLEILVLIAELAARASGAPFDPRVQRVIDTLANAIAAPPKVADLAKMVALSPSRLAHLFKAQTGESIIEMQMKLRLQHAVRLLAQSTRSISEIAEAAGFQSLFQFSRQFKLWYGESPSAYRQKSARG